MRKSIMDIPMTYFEKGEIERYTESIEAYKECFERFIPDDKKDEATEFLSTYGCGLAKDMLKREK